MFNSIFKKHVAPQIAKFYGGQAVYIYPMESELDPVDLENVIIGDYGRERRNTDFGIDIYEVRYFQMILDPESERWCGINSLAIGGRLRVGDGEDCVEWPIDEMPAVNESGFTKIKCARHLRSEIGNSKARG